MDLSYVTSQEARGWAVQSQHTEPETRRFLDACVKLSQELPEALDHPRSNRASPNRPDNLEEMFNLVVFPIV